MKKIFVLLLVVLFASVSMADDCCTKRGDLNLDGSVNILDLSYFTGYMFDHSSLDYPMTCYDNFDLNDDTHVNIIDFTILIEHLFRGKRILPCSVIIPVAGEFISPTPYWMDVACSLATIDGTVLEDGSIIKAYDPEGTLCGADTVEFGKIGWIHIYGDFSGTEVDEGAIDGDLIGFKCNGKVIDALPPVYWQSKVFVFVRGFKTSQFID